MLTALMATTRSAKGVYVIRFFLGLCESSAWPGMMTLFSMLHAPLLLFLLFLTYCISVLVYTNRAGKAQGVLPFMSGPRPDDVWCHTNGNYEDH